MGHSALFYLRSFNACMYFRTMIRSSSVIVSRCVLIAFVTLSFIMPLLMGVKPLKEGLSCHFLTSRNIAQANVLRCRTITSFFRP